MQFCLLGEVPEQPDTSRVLQAMALKGLDAPSSKTSAWRWAHGESRPKMDYAKLLAAQLSQPKLAQWWQGLDRAGVLEADNQIRLMSFIDSWVSAEVDEDSLTQQLQWLWNRWAPKKRGVGFGYEAGSSVSWEIEAIKPERLPNPIRPELAHRSDLTSMATLLVSLCDQVWPSEPAASESKPFEHVHAFTSWCVDLLGCCMLIERLYQQWGDASYTQASPGIDVAVCVLRLALPKRPVGIMQLRSEPDRHEHHVRQLSTLFTGRGVVINHPDQFAKTFTAFAALIDRLLTEAGSSALAVAQFGNALIKGYPSPNGSSVHSVQ
jgi:hypothetical protein